MIRFGQEEFAELVGYVAENYGIDLSKKQILAECRLSSEIDRYGCVCLKDFLGKMKRDKTGQMETVLLNRLTTNYTYFMREKKHFDYLEQEILPSLSRKGRKDSFHIWCAGCSSGQECYTLAMLLQNYRDRGGFLPEFEILGSDISQTALRQAAEGRYPVRELETIPCAWRRLYCVSDEKTQSFTVREDLRAKVGFRRMNLLKPYAGHREYDLVVCRNVMIYFREEARKKLLERLHASLKPGGYLFVGHTELLPRNNDQFDYICPAVYRKRGAYD